jgi:hypothetical protein
LPRFPDRPPSPDGALFLDVTCRSASEPRSHPVFLRDDWSVFTVHDLETERALVALGGTCTCLDFVDHTVPIARSWLRRELREEFLTMRAEDPSEFRSSFELPCCRPGAAAVVAEHLRSVQHVANEWGAPHTPSLERLAARLRAIYRAALAEPDTSLVGYAVRDTLELVELWRAGQHPEWIASVHTSVGARAPLPKEFYLGVAARHPDLVWIRRTARGGSPELFSWLAWTEGAVDRACKQRRTTWLELGIPTEQIDVLNRSRYEPADVIDLARRFGGNVEAAADVLAALVAADVQPSYTSVAASVAGLVCVERSDVEQLGTRLRIHGIPATSEELACALLRCGSVTVALEVMLTNQSLEPAAVAEGLRRRERARAAAWRRRNGSLGA